MKLNLVDKFIEYAAPGWACKRAMFRQGLEALSGYDAAKRERLQPWSTPGGTSEQISGPARDILRERARDLERNSDISEAVVGVIERNVIGTGIRPQARVKKSDGNFDEKANEQLENAWNIWIRKENCDISRRLNYYDFQRVMIRRRVVDGESLCHPVTVKGAKIPLKLQGLEPEWLATFLYKSPTGNNVIINGVEVDQYYGALGYWIQQVSPDGLSYMDPIRISADEMIHLYTIKRFSDVRGVSEMAHVMRRMRETGEFLDAKMIAEKINACFAMFVTKQNGAGAIGRMPVDSKGQRISSIEPGMIEYLLPGEQVNTANPSKDSASVKDFVQVEQRLAGAGMGLSYEAVSRDVSQTNYSSFRGNHLEDRKTFQYMQYYMIENFCRPIWERFVEAAVLSGEVKFPDYWSNPDKYLAVSWIAPGWEWIDPLDEVKASKEELKSGLSTLSETAASQGKDWREQIDQMAREKQYAESKGLQLDIHNPDVKGVDPNAPRSVKK